MRDLFMEIFRSLRLPRRGLRWIYSRIIWKIYLNGIGDEKAITTMLRIPSDRVDASPNKAIVTMKI